MNGHNILQTWAREYRDIFLMARCPRVTGISQLQRNPLVIAFIESELMSHATILYKGVLNCTFFI